MSRVAEITGALQEFTTEELQQVERALISIYRQRRTGIIFDDAYGTWTEENQAAAASQAFTLMEEAEKKHDVSLEEITKRLEVVAALQKGLDSLDRGEGKSIDEVEKLMASWITK